MAEHKKNIKNLEIAQKYGVTTKTVRRWKARGAPIDDPDRLDKWVASQRQLVSKASEYVSRPAEVSPTEPPTETLGLEALVLYCQGHVYRSQQRLDAAHKAADAVLIRSATDSFEEAALLLSRLSKQVDQDRLVKNALVERVEVERALRTLASLQRVGATQTADSLGEELASETDLFRCRALVKKCGYQLAVLTCSCLAPMGVPAWMADCFKDDLINSITVKREEFEFLEREICAALVNIIPRIIADEPHFPPEPRYELSSPSTPTV